MVGVGRDEGSIAAIERGVGEASNRSRITGSEPADAGGPEATLEGSTVVPSQWDGDIPGLGTPKIDAAERTTERVDPRLLRRNLPEPSEIT
ncbi:hypothetical protein [Halosimplex sp. J119]